MKHTNGIPCEYCQEMLLDAHPDLRLWFYEIREEFPTAHCAYVWRGKDSQDEMVAKGKSLLKWPNSKHNVMEGTEARSHAFDLFFQTDEGKYEASIASLSRIWRFLEDKKAPMTWGGHFKHLVDCPHFQLDESYVVVNGKMQKPKA